MYEKVYTALATIAFKTGDPGPLRNFFYHKTWDAVLGTSQYSWFRIFHDGSFARYGQPSGTYSFIGRIGGVPAYIEQWTGAIVSSYEVNGLPNQSDILNPDYLIPYTNPYYARLKFVDDVNQIFVRWVTANTWEVRSLVDGSLIRTITHDKNFAPDCMSWAGHGLICAIRYSDGFVCFMDYLGDQGVTETGSIGACRAATYDCLCRIFLVYQTDHKVGVYVRDAIPATLGNPIFVTSPVEGLKAHSVKVRLLGSTGEPCVGWWIHWLLDDDAGVGPYGWLDKYVSQTDEDGYAWNTYFGPRDGETGNTILKAWVEL
jgi:hypothetical protein